MESMNQSDETQVVKSSFCHQCRQKRTDNVGTCVTKKRTRPCAVKMCPSCLWNRYGEIAREVASRNDWSCPKCRGICNCSTCRKKQGKKPTGILASAAKASGCTNAFEFLQKEGSDKYFYKPKVKPENHVPVMRTRKAKRNELNDSSAGSSQKNAAELNDSSAGCSQEIDEYQLEEVKLPQGTDSITVSGIELPPENAASVLQFLEFCSAFRKVPELEDGQAECVVRETLYGRSTSSQEHSTLTQMIIKLLSLIVTDRGEKSICLSATDDTWFTALGECLAESEVKLDHFPPEMFQKGIAEYEEMGSSQRLKLLNFLCDEALGTAVLRDFIDNCESVERKKEAKEQLNAAKHKVKQLEQKIKDELAKAEAENNGIMLTIDQKVAIVSRMDAESEALYAELQNALEMQPKKGQVYDDAVRTSRVELDDNGLILWRLNSYKEEPNILLQDLGSSSDVCPHENWFAFTPEQKPQVEEFITFKRKKRLLEKKKGKSILES